MDKIEECYLDDFI